LFWNVIHYYVLVQVPALLLVPGPTTALYTTGGSAGLVVDVGYRCIHVMAVAHGMPLLHSYTSE